jgi:hypothetical protein
MQDTITYKYNNPSNVYKGEGGEELFLAKYSEVQKNLSPCFFWGNLKDSFTIAKCLIALANVVKSSFNLSPFQIALLKDPIVTAGNEKLRFEGFSHCAGVYARVDVLADSIDGEFLANGTTNVDFNQPMISALSGIRKKEDVILSVGEKEVGLHKSGKSIIERKVPLPSKWIKGLTSVQLFLAETELRFEFNKVQTLQLFKSLPKTQVKVDYYLTVRGNKPMFSPVKSINAICIGGIHRLRLLESILPFADKLSVFNHSSGQSSTWQLYFGELRFSLTLSRDAWRGFSGEGALLDSLIEDVPESWIDAMDNYSYTNQEFNATALALNQNLDLKKVTNLSSQLAAMGMLGYDLDDNQYFYRRLPYKLERIMSLNPRLKSAEKLLEEDKVKIISRDDQKIESRVEGSGIEHMVLIDGESEKCTCTWFSKYQGERGPCKHILATKKKVLNF